MADSFLFMADAHIKSRTWTNNLQLTGDAYAALSMISEVQVKNPIQTLVIGGDWFDSNRPSAKDLIQTVWFLSQFTTVYHISGNHDNIAPSFLDALKEADMAGTKVIHLTTTPVVLSENNVYICGIDWKASSEDLQKTLAQVCDAWMKEHDRSDVLYVVLHTSFQHLLAFDGAYKLTADFVKSIVGEHSIRILVGDIHVRDMLPLDHPGQYIYSPGSLYPLSFDKTGDDHSVSVIDAYSGAVVTVPTNVRSYCTIRYTTAEELYTRIQEFVQQCSSDRLSPFIRVIVPDAETVRIDQTKIKDAVVQVIRESGAEDEQAAVATEGMTLLEAVCDELCDSSLEQNLAERLLTADDPLDEIKGWLDFWKVKQTT